MFGTCQAVAKLRSEHQSRMMAEYFCPALERIRVIDKVYVEGIGPAAKAHKAKDLLETKCGKQLIRLEEVPADHLHIKCRECFKMGGVR